MKAEFIPSGDNGTQIEPRTGKKFRLTELQKYVKGSIEKIQLDKVTFVVNDNRQGLFLNVEATRVFNMTLYEFNERNKKKYLPIELFGDVVILYS